MFMDVLNQVAFIFYEDIAGAREETITAFCTLARFQIPLKKIVSQSRMFVHKLKLRKNKTHLFMPRRL